MLDEFPRVLSPSSQQNTPYHDGLECVKILTSITNNTISLQQNRNKRGRSVLRFNRNCHGVTANSSQSYCNRHLSL